MHFLLSTAAGRAEKKLTSKTRLSYHIKWFCFSLSESESVSSMTRVFIKGKRTFLNVLYNYFFSDTLSAILYSSSSMKLFVSKPVNMIQQTRMVLRSTNAISTGAKMPELNSCTVNKTSRQMMESKFLLYFTEQWWTQVSPNLGRSLLKPSPVAIKWMQLRWSHTLSHSWRGWLRPILNRKNALDGVNAILNCYLK